MNLARIFPAGSYFLIFLTDWTSELIVISKFYPGKYREHNKSMKKNLQLYFLFLTELIAVLWIYSTKCIIIIFLKKFLTERQFS